MKHNKLILVYGLVEWRFRDLIRALLQINFVLDIKPKHWKFRASNF